MSLSEKENLTDYNGVVFQESALGKVRGIAVCAWDRLGIERVLKQFKIISLGNTKDDDLLTELIEPFPEKIEVSQENTKGILSNPMVSDRIRNNPVWRLFTYKNSESVKSLCESMNVNTFAVPVEMSLELENKNLFRNLCAGLINVKFPDYFCVERNDLKNLDYGDVFRRFGKFVIQEDSSSAGRGTFIICNEGDFVSALDTIYKRKKTKNLVISKFVYGSVASVQVCVGSKEIFCSQLQTQITYNHFLCDMNLNASETFCGGEWGYSGFSTKAQNQVELIVGEIGNVLQERGYRGILSIDFIVAKNSDVFVLEVNARLTGLTAALSMLLNRAKSPSLLLLHLLELGQIEYSVNTSGNVKKDLYGGYLILHNRTGRDVTLCEDLIPGVYLLKENKLIFVRNGYSFEDLQNTEEFILACIPKVNIVIGKGKRVLRVLTLGRVLRDTNNLVDKYKKIINLLELDYFISPT